MIQVEAIPEGPAWVVGFAAGGLLVAGMVKVILSTVAQLRGNGKGNGTTASFLAASVEVRELRDAVIRMEERLAAMPTREDLNNVAEKNRHAYGNFLQRVEVAVDELTRAQKGRR